MFKDSPKK